MNRRDALISEGVRASGYSNCKLFVQQVTGVSRLQDLSSRPFHSVGDLGVGDILKWGTGRHYAIYLGQGEVMEVEEWGAPMRIAPLAEIMDEMDPPDAVLSSTAPARARLNPLGLPVPQGAPLVLVGPHGERTHLYSEKLRDVICKSGKNAGRYASGANRAKALAARKKKGREFYPSDASEVTCYRCAKLAGINIAAGRKPWGVP